MSWARYIMPLKRGKTCDRCKGTKRDTFAIGYYRFGRWRNEDDTKRCAPCVMAYLRAMRYDRQWNSGYRGVEVRSGYSMPAWFHLHFGDPCYKQDITTNDPMFSAIIDRTIEALEAA